MSAAGVSGKGREKENFRDRIATVDKSGRRKWIYAVQPAGKLYNYRAALSYIYFLILFGLPFIHVDGRPLFLFNIPDARFILFGKVFWPQDFFIFGVGMITFIFFIVLFTAAFGRLFCGWICPQTIFMELLFRRLEFWIVGSAAYQKQLKKQPWTTEKIIKIGGKHVAFFILSFLIANCFLSYVIGIKELQKIVMEPVSEHLGGFFAIMTFSGVFYAVFAFFREQVCTAVCPYGRLQGVLLDKNSVVVAYDYKRGEPRGNFKKNENLGDCIDCFQCVTVCPTGIDIRDGVQMECVGCTACIDACNKVMNKINKPEGLIRYASENSIENKEPLRYTTRMKLYSALCLLMISILTVLLYTRKDIDATVIRTPGILFQERGADSISNLYTIKLINKTVKDIPLSIRLKDIDGAINVIGKPIVAPKEGQSSGTFFVILPRKAIQQRKTTIDLSLYEGDKEVATVSSSFAGPVAVND